MFSFTGKWLILKHRFTMDLKQEWHDKISFYYWMTEHFDHRVLLLDESIMKHAVQNSDFVTMICVKPIKIDV